jgi:hypothetical protein
MTAFDKAWAIVKESGPPLNRLEEGEWMEHPEGYQDFRIQSKIDMQNEGPMAGNYPAKNDYSLTRRTERHPKHGLLITQEPAGSNVNLSEVLMATHYNDWDKSRENDVPLSPQTEDYLIADLQSTGRHEAVHQAVHDMLREEGFKSPLMAMPDEREAYSNATEWAANLLQHTDPMRAWNQLRSHSQFRENEAVQEIAERRMYG